MRKHRLPGIIATLLLTVATVGTSVAFAASTNGLSPRTLGAWTIPGGTGAPTVVTWDSFTGTNGTSLSGRALSGGGNWVVNGGTWTIQTNRAASTSATRARISVAGGNQNRSALATLTIGASARAGLVALDSGTAYIYAVYSKASSGTMQLYKFSGSATLLASVTGIGLPATAEMKLDASTNTIRVSFAGVQVLSYTLTAAEITTFKNAANNRYGLIADADSVTRFDDFHVDA